LFDFTSPKMTVDEIMGKIKEQFPSGVTLLDRKEKRRIYYTVDKDLIFKFCQYIKDALLFDQASCVCGVDRIDRFQTVYHICSYANSVTIEITVDIPHDNPEVDSVTPLWGGANWHERETYDMFGIVFKGHPKLERILLPADYRFFPMRKDIAKGGK
jgi:NADH-quinone oxidoreductase subunit C